MPASYHDSNNLLAALEASERRRQAVLDTVLDAVIAINREGTIEAANAAVKRVFGYAPEELLGQNVRMLMPDPDRSAHDSYLEAYERTGDPKIIGIGRIVTALRKDGSTFPAQLTVGETELEGQTLYTGVIHDVTLRQKAIQELSETRERLEYAISATSDGVWELNLVTGELYESRVMREMTGISDRPDLHLLDLLDAPQRARAEEMQVVHLREQKPYDIEFPCVLPDGRCRWFRSRAKAVRDENGTPIRLVGSLSDVTERKETVQALEEMAETLSAKVHERTAKLRLANAELERAARAKDSFLASMSHELRTPLNAILGLTEAMLEDVYGSLTSDQRRTLGTIESSGRHLLALISDVLDLAKIQAGRLELEREPVSVGDLAHACLSYVRRQASQKEIHLAMIEVDPQLVIQSDGRRLKQVLINLLANAVKFTPEGGRVTLDVRPRIAERGVEFRVEDTGIGIPEDRMLEIFQPFRQVDGDLSRQYEGTGLGLALVRELVDALGGGISLTSEIGRGSEFIVTIPWDWDDAATHDTTHRALPRRALVIEDNSSDADRLLRYLRELGIETFVVNDTAAAFDRLKEIEPDVVLLDVIMPDESGWAFLRRLHDTPTFRALPVIVVSVLDDRPVSLAHGAIGHIVKPFSREDLQQALMIVSAPASPSEFKMVASNVRAVKVLLAEDNEANIQAMGDYLRRHGLMVIVARNGREAVDVARLESPEVILMDIQMPLMDGLEAIRRIRAEEESRVPIFALTALAMPGDEERCLQAGADKYLSKPVRLSELLSLILSEVPSPK